MAVFFKKSTKTTPEIVIDSDNKYFKLSGISRPEDVRSFYFGTIEALPMLFQKDGEKEVTMDFELTYFNSSSAKFIADLMVEGKKAIEQGIPCNFRWFYFEDDEDMLEVGNDFSDMIGVPFQFIIIKRSNVL